MAKKSASKVKGTAGKVASAKKTKATKVAAKQVGGKKPVVKNALTKKPASAKRANGTAPTQIFSKTDTTVANPPKEADGQEQLCHKIVTALTTDKPQFHFDDIVKATGGEADAVAAALMGLELEHKVKSLPGKFWRLLEPAKGSANSEKIRRSGKPRGKLSILDAAAEILKGAKEPLGVKEITRQIFEQGLAASNGRTPHATLSAAMGREIKAKGAQSRFCRADRGRFALSA